MSVNYLCMYFLVPEVYDALMTESDFVLEFRMKIGWSARGMEMSDPRWIPTNYGIHTIFEMGNNQCFRNVYCVLIQCIKEVSCR